MNRTNIPYTKQAIIATSCILSMVADVDSIKADYDELIRSNPQDKTLPYSQKERTEMLEKVIADLRNIMEYLGEYCNNCDIVFEEDECFHNAAFRVLDSNEEE